VKTAPALNLRAPVHISPAVARHTTSGSRLLLTSRLSSLDPGPCRVTAYTVQGMARVRSGQAPAWPLSSDRSVRRGSRVQRDFACTCARHLSPALVALGSQSRWRLEGRTRTLSGPSPDPEEAPVTCSASRADDRAAMLPRGPRPGQLGAKADGSSRSAPRGR
jgi:hypothetical protein